MKRILGIPRVRALLGAIAASGMFGIIGCGTSDGGPQTYVLDRDSNHVAVGALASIGPFSVPSGATIDYSIVDTPVGIGSDSLTSSIDPGGYTARSGSSISAATGPLPAGYYYLDVSCDNILDDCYFDDEGRATY
jgi:hypothetical protein